MDVLEKKSSGQNKGEKFGETAKKWPGKITVGEQWLQNGNDIFFKYCIKITVGIKREKQWSIFHKHQMNSWIVMGKKTSVCIAGIIYFAFSTDNPSYKEPVVMDHSSKEEEEEK